MKFVIKARMGVDSDWYKISIANGLIDLKNKLIYYKQFWRHFKVLYINN